MWGKNAEAYASYILRSMYDEGVDPMQSTHNCDVIIYC